MRGTAGVWGAMVVGALGVVGFASLLPNRPAPSEIAVAQASKVPAVDWPVLNERGRARAHQGDYQGAIKWFDQAIALNPRSALLLNNRGGALMGLGDLQGALREFSRGVELDPDYPELRLNRAQARSDLGDWRGAVEDLEIALALSPDSWPYRAFASDRLETARRNRNSARAY